jgi:hypothetical protein
VIDGRVALAAPGLIVARQHRKSLQQRRFAGAVLADDDGDGAIEAEREIVVQEWQAERIGLAVGNACWLKPYPSEVWGRQIDVAISP